MGCVVEFFCGRDTVDLTRTLELLNRDPFLARSLAAKTYKHY
jgi:hypothetical protein